MVKEDRIALHAGVSVKLEPTSYSYNNYYKFVQVKSLTLLWDESKLK